MIMTLKKSIKTAVEILGSGTEYIREREMIDGIFKMTRKSVSKETIHMRLTVIDSFYSTNMNRRLFGINDLSGEILSIGNEDALLQEITKYKKNEKSEIDKLLEKKYGIHKNGNEGERARSLISKYLYFVTGHNFPIEDTLVKVNLENVIKYYALEVKSDNDILKKILFICAQNNLQFDEFDNFMWLLGKINKGSLSLVTNKDSYTQLIRKLNINKNIKSSDFDKKLSMKLKNEEYLEVIKDRISGELYNFLKLNIDINKKNIQYPLQR